MVDESFECRTKVVGLELDRKGIRRCALLDRWCIPDSSWTCLGSNTTYMPKCGSLSQATQVFYDIKYKDVFAWNTIIAGMAMHGHANKALQLFDEMPETGIKPDDNTFVAVLSACSHAGRVDEGYGLLNCMSETYRIIPKVEHYGCIIDLLARAGLVEEALMLIQTMPVEPNASAWGALLGGCRIHNNIKVGELVGSRFLKLQPQHSGRKLSEITTRLKNAFGYLPDTKEALFDIKEEEKEHALAVHSEKLAIAYGLIQSNPPAPVRIVKNLRVCVDCHHWTKMISEVYEREIIVRDWNRFHHFVEGRCSCRDHW
ncbi:pentatricopeptide repeat-containing protein At5g06540-like [Aristolochia californica]|uniref:pentatricopeptide repeat-containing protein At5g06540-like n=1 Tax=Aristolochia californica TaxID=171875 RepID=UPI0035D6D221